MSHSKRRARGQSYYLDAVNPKVRKYLRVCRQCEHVGIDPRILSGELAATLYLFAREELARLYEPLSLNDAGICDACCQATKTGDGDDL